MSLFVDTNILLRIAQRSHVMHDKAFGTVFDAFLRGEKLFVTPQILAEFWCVATRPEIHNGLGMAPGDARRMLDWLDAFFTLLNESQLVCEEWKRLVSHHEVNGVKAHDARIVAAMNIYGIRDILTFNPDDFKRYKNIQTITP